MAQKPENTGEDTGAVEAQKPFNLESMKEINQKSFEALCGMNDRLCECVRGYNEEMLRLMNQQFQLNAKLPAELMKCKTPQNVTDVCAQFMQSAMTHNIEQTERLMRMGSQFAGDMLKLMQQAPPAKR